MGNGNENLYKAKGAKNDEVYTIKWCVERTRDLSKRIPLPFVA